MKSLGYLRISAIAISVFSLASCYNNDVPEIRLDSNPQQNQTNEELRVKLGTITPSKNYTYKIDAGTTVEWYIDGTKKTTGSTFEGEKVKDSQIKIEVIAQSSAYSSKKIEKIVQLDVNGKIIKLDIPKVSKNPTKTSATVAKNDANSKGSTTIENSTANKSLAYNAPTTASMILPKEAISLVGNDKEFYIDIENVATGNTIQDQLVREEFFNIMTIKCGTPGVKLQSDADIKISNSNVEKGMVFKCSSNNEEVKASETGNIVVKTNELDDLTLSCKVRSELIDSTEVIKDEGFFTVAVGNPTITYYTKSGYTCDFKNNEFITKYLTAKFGEYTENAKQTIKISNGDTKAQVPYSLEQKVYKYKVHFGDLTVDVRSFGPDKLNIEVDKAVKFNIDK